MLRSTAEELRPVAQAIFRALGATDEDASHVASSLVDAELCGHQSHGLIRIPEYVRQIREGAIAPKAQPEIVSDSGAALVVDGNWGFGQVVASRATEWLIERARAAGVAAVAVRRCAHVGRAGAYPEMAAVQGLVAFAFVSGGGTEPRVAPHGGARAIFGTNPLAAAIPVEGAPPIVIDFSTAIVASGKIRVLRDRAEPLPEGWILDRDGRPSIRPEDYYAGGMLLPAAGHKGSGLCLLVELLAGCLSGGGSIALPDSGYQVGNSMFMQAFDVNRFMPLARFAEVARALGDVVRSTPPGAGFEEVLVPGDPERRAADRAAADGVNVADSTWRSIESIALDLGVKI